MKRWYSDPFAVAAALLTCVAFAVSYAHTRATIVDHGGYGLGATATALMPEAMVLLSVLWIRRGGEDVRVRWAWLVLVTAVAFTLWGNLAQAEPSIGGYVVAGWPAWAAIGAAGFVEIRKASKDAGGVSVPESSRRPKPSRPVSPATSPAIPRQPLSVGSVPAGGAPTTSVPGAGVGGLRSVPLPSEGKVGAAAAAASEWYGKYGKWPSKGELARELDMAEGTAAHGIRRAKKEVAA